MSGLKQRIPRRRAPGSPRRSDAGFAARLKAGLSRLRPSGLSRLRPAGLSRLRPSAGKRMPWGKRAAQQPAQQPALPAGDPGATTAVATSEVVEPGPDSASFRDRGRLRRRLRFLRRARELAFRDVGGLIFDMRRFGRDRPDLVEAKLNALAAVDQELRALERVLDDRRPIHELREPGLSSCPRCGALHASEDNFCPRCGLQFGGAQAMGEVGGAIAAPPQAPPAPVAQRTAATLVVPGSGLEQASEQAGSAPAPAPSAAAPRPSSGARHGPSRRAARTSAAPASGPDGSTSAPSAEPVRPAHDGPADDEQQTEIYRPHDAS